MLSWARCSSKPSSGLLWIWNGGRVSHLYGWNAGLVGLDCSHLFVDTSQLLVVRIDALYDDIVVGRGETNGVRALYLGFSRDLCHVERCSSVLLLRVRKRVCLPFVLGTEPCTKPCLSVHIAPCYALEQRLLSLRAEFHGHKLVLSFNASADLLGSER